MTQDVRPFQPAGASYSPGGWVALAAGRQWLLLRLAPADPMMQQCWAALSADGSVTDVLDPLFAAGLAATPDFALLLTTDSGCRAVLRGSAEVRYGTTVLTAGEALLLDVQLDDIPADAAVLLTGGDEADTSLQLPLSAGVTMASSIRLVTSDRVRPAVAGTSGDGSPRSGPDEPATSNSPAPKPQGDSAAPSNASPESRSPKEPAGTGSPSPQPNLLKERTATGSDSAPSKEAAAASSDSPPPRVADKPVAEPIRPIPTAETPTPQAEPEPAGEFDHLFAATVLPAELRKIRDDLEAAGTPRAVQDTEATAAEPQAAPPPIADTPRAPSVFHTQQWATRPPYEGTGLIDSVPWMADPDATTQPMAPTAQPTTTPPVGNLPIVQAETPAAPQLTVKRSSLAAAVPGSAMVMATRCPAGHPNPPHAAHCRNCRQPVPEQEQIEIARPILGVLRLSTGETVSLDRGVLIGREPADPDPVGGERPHVLRLPDDLQVSRNHVEVSIDGWRVQVADLGSTNGTFVTPPQQPTMRLNERDPQLIEPGTEVRLSDDFSFEYQVGS